jgi:hypothetical protein
MVIIQRSLNSYLTWPLRICHLYNPAVCDPNWLADLVNSKMKTFSSQCEGEVGTATQGRQGKSAIELLASVAGGLFPIDVLRGLRGDERVLVKRAVEVSMEEMGGGLGKHEQKGSVGIWYL